MIDTNFILDKFNIHKNHLENGVKLLKEKHQIQDDFNFLSKYTNTIWMKMHPYTKYFFKKGG